jgi:hypothetical protein
MYDVSKMDVYSWQPHAVLKEENKKGFVAIKNVVDRIYSARPDSINHIIPSASMIELSFLSKPGFSFTSFLQTASVITGLMAMSHIPFQPLY